MHSSRITVVVAMSLLAALVGTAAAGAQAPSPSAPGTLSGLRYEPKYEITRSDGSFIPPAERVVTAIVSWRSTESTGEFRVLARRSPTSAAEPRGVVLATAAVDGAFEFKETWTFFDHPVCYIVQAGAVESEVCRPVPPTSGSQTAPTAVAAPWPAPEVEIETISLNNPPFFVNLSWPLVPGFTGVYEVQRAASSTNIQDPDGSTFRRSRPSPQRRR